MMIMKAKKELKALLFIILMQFLSIGVIFAQNNTLNGAWYYMDEFNSTIYMRVFNENRTGEFNFPLTGTSQYSTRAMSLTMKNFTIESLGKINIDGRSYTYNTSPQVLILWEGSGAFSGPKYYRPIFEININSLIGNWVVPGEEFDIELEITANSLIIKKGRVQRSYTYTSEGFPNINFRDSSGTISRRNYFFFGRDIVSLNIPGENGTMIFQRKN